MTTNVDCEEGDGEVRGASICKDVFIITVDGYAKTVSNYETYITFYVITKTTRPEYPRDSFQVSRRYSAFEWLQWRLRHTYPSTFIPPLPGKKLTYSLERFGTNFINRRTTGLQSFLHRLSSHPVLSFSQDLIAFLTLEDKEFHSFQESHPCSNLLTGLLKSERLAELTGSSQGETWSDASSDGMNSKDCFIPSTAQQLCSEEFQAYSQEASTFSATAQRLARVTERISTELSTLAADYSELATCLEGWPPELQLEETIARQRKTDNETGGSADPVSTSIGLRWGRHPPALPVAVAKAARVSSVNASHLSNCLQNEAFVEWDEAAAYARSVKDTLKSREDLEKEYLSVEQRIGSRVSNQPNGMPAVTRTSDLYDADNAHTTGIGFPFSLFRRKALPELVSQANDLQDRLAFTNGQLRVDFQRWRKERSQDTLENLLRMVKAYSTHWSKCTDAWREVLSSLESSNERSNSMLPPTLGEANQLATEIEQKLCLQSSEEATTTSNSSWAAWPEGGENLPAVLPSPDALSNRGDVPLDTDI